MGKIKLNLESGAVVEKPLIIAFRANNLEYVVLDNEMNGSMGLPIILVCKLENGKLIKIEDQNEWQIVKEYLKNIIAGSQIELVKIPSILSASDIYYTQLTLPVPSFDALKKAYTIDSNSENGEVGIADINIDNSANINMPNNVQPSIDPVVSPIQSNDIPVSPTVTPVVANPEISNTNVNQIPNVPNTNPQVEDTLNIQLQNSGNAPAIDLGIPTVPIMDSPIPVNQVSNINDSIPTVNNAEDNSIESMISPVNDTLAQNNQTLSENEPVVSIVPESENESPFKEQKEAFMQACENMFDALVQKFEKELENKQ